jgi:DNA (cytosine-5)-methyltransferase 1
MLKERIGYLEAKRRVEAASASGPVEVAAPLGSLALADCSTVRPRALDLFCCAGGAGMGLHRAGFDVTGYDLRPQPRYPFRFVQGNALEADLTGYDFVWASPPCQAHSPLKHRTGKEYECFIERTRAKLKAWGGPYIIENVMGAPLINPVMLCGAMFPPLRVYRHRIFESNVALAVPPHPKHVVPCAPQRQRKAAFAAGKFVTVTGDIGRYAGEAMGIDWATGNEMSQAIPPAYSEFLGRQIIQTLK